MSVNLIIIFVLVAFCLVAFIGLSLFFLGRSATAAKLGKQCFVFRSDESFLEIQADLSKAGIQYSHFLWAPSQTGFNSPGAAPRTPKEIWISESDVEKAILLINRKYSVENTTVAMIIGEKLILEGK